jgi:hypothetical protein
MKQNYKLLLSCLSLLIGFTSLGQTITRGPYLQKGTPTSVVLKWKTNISADTQIEYSLDENFSSSTFVPSSNPFISKNHQIEITGLSPYTKYYYRIPGSNLNKAPDLFFNTHPAIITSDPYTF